MRHFSWIQSAIISLLLSSYFGALADTVEEYASCAEVRSVQLAKLDGMIGAWQKVNMAEEIHLYCNRTEPLRLT